MEFALINLDCRKLRSLQIPIENLQGRSFHLRRYFKYIFVQDQNCGINSFTLSQLKYTCCGFS